MRRLGNSGLEVFPLALGGNVFGWTIDEPASFRVLDAFVANGFNLIDTADVYSAWAPGNKGGESETIIGKWLQQSGKREDVLIATKVGSEMGAGKKGLSKAHIMQAVEDSLRRLQTDRIDLYQSHIDDPAAPLDETLEAYAKLIGQGKVRAIGASNTQSARLSEAAQIARRTGYPGYQSVQPLYNLYDRADFETDLQSFCLENQLGVIPYFSLASGFLTGKYRFSADLAKAARGSMVSKYMNDRGKRILDALDILAARYKSTPAAISLAWLIARPGVTAPIASATSPEQLDQLIEATRLDLDTAAMELLNTASAS